MQTFDEWVVLWIRRHLSCPFLDKAMLFITRLGNHGGIWLLLSLGMIARGRTAKRDWRKWGALLLMSLLTTAAVGNLVIKPVIKRVRPYERLSMKILIKRPLDFSFPSGHTSAGFSAAAVLYAMDKGWGWFMYHFAFLMAFSRLYLAVHYPLDLFVGALLGTFISKGICGFMSSIGKLPKS